MKDPLAEYESWLRVEKGLADTTVKAYVRENRDLGPRIAVLQVDDLRTLLHSRAAKPATTARRIAAWKSYFAWQVRTDRRADDPTAKLDRPKVVRGLPRPVDDLDAVIANLDPPYQDIALFLFETGLRISEAMQVDVVTIPAELRVRGKGGKERVVPLTEVAKAALTDLGGSIPVSTRQVQAKFRKVGITPHRLRHSIATELARRGVDLSVIQDFLGHASPATTRVYQRNDVSRIREGLERR